MAMVPGRAKAKSREEFLFKSIVNITREERSRLVAARARTVLTSSLAHTTSFGSHKRTPKSGAENVVYVDQDIRRELLALYHTDGLLARVVDVVSEAMSKTYTIMHEGHEVPRHDIMSPKEEHMLQRLIPDIVRAYLMDGIVPFDTRVEDNGDVTVYVVPGDEVRYAVHLVDGRTHSIVGHRRPVETPDTSTGTGDSMVEFEEDPEMHMYCDGTKPSRAGRLNSAMPRALQQFKDLRNSEATWGLAAVGMAAPPLTVVQTSRVETETTEPAPGQHWVQAMNPAGGGRSRVDLGNIATAATNLVDEEYGEEDDMPADDVEEAQASYTNMPGMAQLGQGFLVGDVALRRGLNRGGVRHVPSGWAVAPTHMAQIPAHGLERIVMQREQFAVLMGVPVDRLFETNQKIASNTGAKNVSWDNTKMKIEGVLSEVYPLMIRVINLRYLDRANKEKPALEANIVKAERKLQAFMDEMKGRAKAPDGAPVEGGNFEPLNTDRLERLVAKLDASKMMLERMEAEIDRITAITTVIASMTFQYMDPDHPPDDVKHEFYDGVLSQFGLDIPRKHQSPELFSHALRMLTGAGIQPKFPPLALRTLILAKPSPGAPSATPADNDKDKAGDGNTAKSQDDGQKDKGDKKPSKSDDAAATKSDDAATSKSDDEAARKRDAPTKGKVKEEKPTTRKKRATEAPSARSTKRKRA